MGTNGKYITHLPVLPDGDLGNRHPLGIVGAVHQNQWMDRVLRILSYIGQGFPSFITALILLIGAQNLSPWLPVGGMTSVHHSDLNPLGQCLDVLWHMILPTIALSITSFAGLQRITRGNYWMFYDRTTSKPHGQKDYQKTESFTSMPCVMLSTPS